MFTSIFNLYGCSRRKEDKARLLMQQRIDQTVLELNLLTDSLYVGYDQQQWDKLNKITELSRLYKSLTGKVYRRKEHYIFLNDDNITEENAT